MVTKEKIKKWIEREKIIINTNNDSITAKLKEMKYRYIDARKPFEKLVCDIEEYDGFKELSTEVKS